MRNRIFGLVGVLWGGSVLFGAFRDGFPLDTSQTSRMVGHIMGYVLATALFLVGLYYLITGWKKKAADQDAEGTAGQQ